MTLYEVLGVRRNATTATIRRAYLKKCKEHHPDKGGDAEEFRRVQHAWEVLGDDARRRRYDDTGDDSHSTPEEAERRKVIGGIVATIMQNVMAAGTDIRYVNVLESIRRQMEDKRVVMQRDEVNTHAAIKRAEDLAKRFKHHGDGPDFISGALSNHLGVLRANLANIQKSIEIHGQVCEVFEAYDYSTDSPWGEGGQSSATRGASRQMLPGYLRTLRAPDPNDEV